MHYVILFARLFLVLETRLRESPVHYHANCKIVSLLTRVLILVGLLYSQKVSSFELLRDTDACVDSFAESLSIDGVDRDGIEKVIASSEQELQQIDDVWFSSDIYRITAIPNLRPGFVISANRTAEYHYFRDENRRDHIIWGSFRSILCGGTGSVIILFSAALTKEGAGSPHFPTFLTLSNQMQ
jgi:hypothetical protein